MEADVLFQNFQSSAAAGFFPSLRLHHWIHSQTILLLQTVITHQNRLYIYLCRFFVRIFCHRHAKWILTAAAAAKETAQRTLFLPSSESNNIYCHCSCHTACLPACLAVVVITIRIQYKEGTVIIIIRTNKIQSKQIARKSCLPIYKQPTTSLAEKRATHNEMYTEFHVAQVCWRTGRTTV